MFTYRVPEKIHEGTHFIFRLRRYNFVPGSSIHGGGRIRSLMVPDLLPRNGIGIKYEKVSRWWLRARQNERECDVSVVSGLFMALLVTAVAFVAVKFRQLWFRARDHERKRERKRETAYPRLHSARNPGRRKRKKIDATDKEANIQKKFAMKILYL